MPFENTGRDRRYFRLGEAAAVVLADDLAARGIDAIPRDERRAAFDRPQVPATAVLTDATTFRIAQLVGAAEVVVGAFQVDAEALTVRVRAIGLEAGILRATAEGQGPLGDFFSIVDALADRIAARAGQAPTVATGAGASAADSGVAGGTPSRAARAAPRPSMTVLENFIKGVLAEDPATASRHLGVALRDDPAYDPVRLALWTVYTNQGDHTRARAAVDGVKPDSALADRAAFLAGLSQLSARKAADAVGAFDRLATKRATASVVNNAGVARLQRDWPSSAEAVSFFRRAHDAEPDDVDYLFNLGYATWLGRDATGAVRWLREVVRRSPADGDAHFLMGIALADVSEAAEAMREKDLARRLSSSYQEWDKGTGAERTPRGIERVKRGVDLPRRAGVEETLATAGQRDQRELARFYVERARRSYERGGDRDAASDLDRALYHAPYDAEALLLMGRLHARGGRLSDAVSAFKVAPWSAESAEAHVALADVLLRTDERDAARAELDRALVLVPDHPEARRLRLQIDQR